MKARMKLALAGCFLWLGCSAGPDVGAMQSALKGGNGHGHGHGHDRVERVLLLSIDAANHTNLFIFGLGVHGMFVNAVQSTMYPLCAYIYPTNVRATGTASALAFGRIGAILSAFAGASIITATGASGYLAMLGTAMAFVLIALAVVRNHIPRATPKTPT